MAWKFGFSAKYITMQWSFVLKIICHLDEIVFKYDEFISCNQNFLCFIFEQIFLPIYFIVFYSIYDISIILNATSVSIFLIFLFFPSKKWTIYDNTYKIKKKNKIIMKWLILATDIWNVMHSTQLIDICNRNRNEVVACAWHKTYSVYIHLYNQHFYFRINVLLVFFFAYSLKFFVSQFIAFTWKKEIKIIFRRNNCVHWIERIANIKIDKTLKNEKQEIIFWLYRFHRTRFFSRKYTKTLNDWQSTLIYHKSYRLPRYLIPNIKIVRKEKSCWG